MFPRLACVVALAACGDASGPSRPSDAIAFSSDRDGDMEIFVMNSEAADLVQLTTDPHDDTYPAWSPDGQRIAFVSGRDNDTWPRLYTMAADGSDVRPLTEDYGTMPAWSPDGGTIAFVSFRDGIELVNHDGSNRRFLSVPLQFISSSKWSPDGRRIAFHAGAALNRGAIYTIAVDGTALQRLSSVGDDDSFPDYSPDGRSILFSSCRSDGRGCHVSIMDASGDNRRQVTDGPDDDFSPVWSADGRRIAFMRFTHTELRQLFVVNADGSGLRQLTQAPEQSMMPSWLR
jgi:TolB protein